MDDRIILVGWFQELVELAEVCGNEVLGVFGSPGETDCGGLRVLGDDSNADALHRDYGKVPLVVSPDQPARRRTLVSLYASAGFRFASLVHPQAQVSRTATIGQGVIIQGAANVSADTVIGDFVRVNTAANIMHDVNIGEYSTVAPNAVLLGRVAVGEDCYIGANATVLAELAVGRNSVVGAGAVVTRNVPQGKTVAGIPARELGDA